MKFTDLLFIQIIIIVFFLGTSCNDPTVIGSDLLAGDQLDIAFTDTVTLKSYNKKIDSLATFNPSPSVSKIQNFPIGSMEDPIFGTSSSAVYAQPTLNINFPDFDPVLGWDSVVLVLPYFAKGSYGDLEDTYSLEVYQLAENFPDTTLYSNMDYMTESLIGQVDYQPFVNDSVEIIQPGTVNEIIKVPPQLRIPLDETFADYLFALDSPYNSSVPDFEEFFKGIYIKPTSTNKGMPSFTIRAQVTGNSVANAGIRVYYHVDTVYSEYLYPIFSSNVVTAKYEHDYSSSPLNLETEFLGENATHTDSLLFIQGMSGTDFVIEIPYAENLSNKVLNKAELVFPLATLPDDDPNIYLPVDQIIVFEIQDDGTRRVIDDYVLANNRNGPDGFAELFGGDYSSQDSTYKINITTHLQDMSRGLVSEKMVVTLFPKAEQAARMIVNGPGHSIRPAKLDLTFTNF